MELRIDHTDDHRIQFVLKGATDAFANSIRRTLLCDVDALAISSVEFYRNTTAFPDEIIAHRLGMLPLRDSMIENASYTMHIREYDGDVFSDAILPVAGEYPCVLPGVFIVPMQHDQVLHLKAYARRGLPSEHARYGTCVAPAYAIRHDGVTEEECICDRTERVARCENCGHMPANKDLSQRELVHWFTFETTGVPPMVLLNRALGVLHSNLTGLMLALS